MKKKILSTLLAVCLFVGVAIPSVFAYTSDLAGNAHRVTKITADAKSYDIKVGESTDFAEKISVFENGQRLVVDLNQIIFAATGDTNKFNINGSVVTAIETGGKITLAIYDDENKLARVEVTVNSTPGTAPDGNYATSFVFSKADRYDVVYDDGKLNKDTDFKFDVEAIPTGTKFSTTNATAIADKVVAEMNAKLGISTLIGQNITGVVGSKNWAAFTADLTPIITGLVDGNVVTIGVGAEKLDVTAGASGVTIGGVVSVKDDMNTPAKALAKIKRALVQNINKTFVFENVTYKYDPTETAVAGGNKISFIQIGAYTNNIISEAGIAAYFTNNTVNVNTHEIYDVQVTAAPAATTDKLVINNIGVMPGTTAAPFVYTYSDYQVGTPGTKAAFVVTITASEAHASNVSVPSLAIVGGTVTVVGDQVAAAANAAAIAAAFDGKKVTIDGMQFTASVAGAVITFTADNSSVVVTAPPNHATTSATLSFTETPVTPGTAPVTNSTNGTADVGSNVNNTIQAAVASFITAYNANGNRLYDAALKATTIDTIRFTARNAGTMVPDITVGTGLAATATMIQQGAGTPSTATVKQVLVAGDISNVKQPTEYANKQYKGVQVTKGYNGETTKIEFSVDRDELNFVTLALTPGKVFNVNNPANITHHMVRQDGNLGLNVTARTNLYPVKAIPITSVGFANTATMKVGEFKTFTVSKYPTNANVGFAGGIKYSTTSRKDVNSNDKYQHAIIWTEDGFKNEGFDVKVRAINSEKIGVSTGKVDAAVVLRAAVTTTNTEGVTSVNNHDATITVIDQDWKDEAVNTPEISTKNATIKVGGQVVLSVKNAPIGSTVKWSIDNANVSVDPATGLATTVRGKKVGNTVVTATMTNPNTSKTETYTCNVTVLAADVTKPGTTPPPVVTPPSTNPPTGDTLFANIG